MPEGPEIKISAELLDFYLHNAKLLSVKIIGGKFFKIPPVGMCMVKYPLTIEKVRSKGKMTIFDFKDTKIKMFAGMGLSGHFKFEKDPYSLLEFSLDTPPPYPTLLYFSDMQQFGTITFSYQDLTERIAPSVLSSHESKENLSLDVFLKRASLLKTTRQIVIVLADQTAKTGLCSGIGNYLVSEILFSAKIRPFRPFNTLTVKELTSIHTHAVRISTESYKNNGASINDYETLTGEKGRYQDLFNVYHRTKTPAGDDVVSEKGKTGRTLWWVPNVQI